MPPSLIFSVTPGSASLESADSFAPVLSDRHTFLDFASATPKIKKSVADKLASSGALLGDGSIEGTPLQGYSMRMLSSGPAGERVREWLVPWGMQIEFTGPVLGTASGIKILRSVLIKGIEALTDEMLLAARQYGIDEIVLGVRLQDAGAALDGYCAQPDAVRRDPRQTPCRGARNVGGRRQGRR